MLEEARCRESLDVFYASPNFLFYATICAAIELCDEGKIDADFLTHSPFDFEDFGGIPDWSYEDCKAAKEALCDIYWLWVT